jgi:hypothetical protein
MGWSGERKTASDAAACGGIHLRQKEWSRWYELEIVGNKATIAAWHAAKRRIELDRTFTMQIRAMRIADLGPEPLPLPQPILTPTDVTVEGLAVNWKELPASLGLFTSEAGVFTQGAAMTEDMKVRTAGSLSSFWDGTPINRIRVGTGVTSVRGKRLAIHGMIQPQLASEFLGDPVLRGQGFLARFLVAHPPSLVGGRLFRRSPIDVQRQIGDFTNLSLRLLQQSWKFRNGSNELEPEVLTIPQDSEAERIWIDYHDEVEIKQRNGGEYSDLRDVASKSAEQACRLAGVLLLITDPIGRTIDSQRMAAGCTLARWYLNEATRLHRQHIFSPILAEAYQLLVWLRANASYDNWHKTAILNRGPNKLRHKDRMDPVLAKLVEHGYVVMDDERRFQVWMGPMESQESQESQ